MPRPGGESDKLGNRYEGIWTIGQLLELAAGKSQALTVEPIGDEASGIEFEVKCLDGTSEFHSVKRQHLREWSLAELARKDRRTGRSILTDLCDRISKDATNKCCFVSSTGANAFRELTECAARAGSFRTFQAELSSRQSLRSGFERYFLPIASDWETAYDYLRRIEVTLVSESRLRKQVEQQLDFLIYRPDRREFSAAEVRALLGDFVLDHLGVELRADSIWAFLAQSGYAHRDWASTSNVRQCVREQNQAYSRAVEFELINGSRVLRADAGTIVEKLSNATAKTVVASGPAGVGKSCVIAQVLDAVESRDVPTLAIRMDRHGSAHTTHEIGIQMRLPQSPAVVLAGIANGRDSVLIVDQLDATSQVSGRYPHLWEVFDSLCHEADTYPNMRLVVACRDFDLEHDHRLRQLKHRLGVEHISIQLLTLAEIDSALVAARCGNASLDLRQKEILRVPLHLFLFLEGLGEDRSEVGFRNIGDLFDRYWQRKQRAVSDRLGYASAWTEIIDRLCESMSGQLVVYAPNVVMDDRRETAMAMLTEHVLVLDGDQIRFFHESFFDYAFARRFCAAGKSLIGLLHSSEQHLFRRSQVRQILTFLRDQSRSQYLKELHNILADAGVRFHLKRLVFGWLGRLADPTEEEWTIIKPHLLDADYQRHILPAIRNSLPWFDLLHRIGVVSEWLASSETALGNRGFWLLMFDPVQKDRSDAVAGLIRRHRTNSPEWTNRLRAYFQFGSAHHSRGIQSLFLELLDEGVFDEGSPSGVGTWWRSLEDAGKQEPLFALEAVLRWLKRQPLIRSDLSERSVLEGRDYDHSAAHLINEIARREPLAYAREMFPLVVEIVTASEMPSHGGLKLDRVWPHRSNHEPSAIGESLLIELVAAAEILATTAPEEFESLTNDLADTEYETIAFVLLRAWSANPGRVGSLCIRFMAADVRRLDIGYGSYSGEGNGYAAISREAIQLCLPYCDANDHQLLEAAILRFNPRRDCDAHDGWTQRLLLEACGDSHLSDVGRNCLSELRQRFPEQDIEIPARSVDQLIPAVGSPIPREEAKELTNEEWLAAMRKFDFGWESRPTFELTGSAVELSRELQPLARSDRQRFASLAAQMDDTIRPDYFSAILEGICGMGDLSKEQRAADNEAFRQLDTEVVLTVVRRLHSLPGRPCGRSICVAFERIADRTIAQADLEILIHYALHRTEPESDPWLKEDDTGTRDPAETAYFHGYNSVRGHASKAIASLLFADYARSDFLLPVVREMVHDPSNAVRTCVMTALLPLLNHDRDEAVRLFLQACQGAERVFGCDPCDHFIGYASSTHYLQLRNVITNALNSSTESAVAAAARQIVLASLSLEDAEADAAHVRVGNENMRLAAAAVYSRNLAISSVRSVCLQFLPTFFADESENVRSRAGDCFSHLTDANFNDFADLIRTYIESPAFPSRHDDLLRRLTESTWQLPDITVRLAERFVLAHGAAAGDISTAAAGDAFTVSKLVVRLYVQTADEAIRTKCLDLIDDMERFGFLGIDSELVEHDR